MASNKPDRCRSEGDNSSQSGKTTAKFLGTGLADSLLSKNNGTPMMAESVSGRPMGSDNYENGGVKVPSTSAHNNQVIETGSSVNAVAGPSDLFRKLLTVRRKLLLNMKQFLTLPERKFGSTQFESDLLHFQNIREAYERFCEKLKGIDDSNRLKELSENMSNQFEACVKLFESCELRFNQQFGEHTLLNVCDGESEIEPADSASQVTDRSSITSDTSSVLKRIELERKKAELRNFQEMTKLKTRKAKLLAEAEERKLLAEAEERKLLAEAEERKLLAEAEERKLLAELEEEEALAKLRLEGAHLEAEEKALECSSRLGSKLGGSSGVQSRSSLRLSGVKKSRLRIKKEAFKRSGELGSVKPGYKRSGDSESISKNNITRLGVGGPTPRDACDMNNFETKPQVLADASRVGTADDLGKKIKENTGRLSSGALVWGQTGKSADFGTWQEKRGSFPLRHVTWPEQNESLGTRGLTSGSLNSNELTFHAYLERQGRNEYINLASQIGYNGNNIAFVFYENQIRRLMDESPYDERRLEVLRASCTGQPREMVNLFCVPMKNMNTSTRIEKALERLRQRYGVSGGLTTEPKVKAVRNGPKVSHDLNSMKIFNEDLNTLEIFAFAHDEVDKLSGQLLLDTASRLPNTLKRRYLDYLNKKGLDLSHRGFDSLRDFVVNEIKTMSSDYAQAFFGSDVKEVKTLRSKNYNVHQVNVDTESNSKGMTKESSLRTGGDIEKKTNFTNEKSLNYKRSKEKSPSCCFVCARSDVKHFLGECEKFKTYSLQNKRQVVLDAGRCLNCLSVEHFVRACPCPSKCRKCGVGCQNKHAGALHECYNGQRLGAAETNEPAVCGTAKNDGARDLNVCKVKTTQNRPVLLRTTAVKVINPVNGKSTLAYAQLDTASQATLISDNLRKELELKAIPDSSVTIRTLADQRLSIGGRTNFELESLDSGEQFMISDALAVPQFLDDARILPHAVDVSELDHFEGVHIPVATERGSVDVLIGQSDKLLLTVLEEREGADPEEPNYVLTRLGPIASGGMVDGNSCSSGSLSALRVKVESPVKVHCDCTKLKAEIKDLKQTVREYELLDEVIQPSQNDKLAQDICEPNIKVIDGRYEIPVPLKPEVKSLPNNYDNALKRTLSLKKSAVRNPDLKQTLSDTFAELISEKWIEPVKDNICTSDKPTWYLPFFVTKTAKPRVVYDGSAAVGGVSLNQVVLSGENLLNGLLEVLIRFRLGKFACVADLCKCFFQVRIPESQQDLFKLIWFKDNDIDNGDVQVYQFTRHVWGINSSPFVALLAIKRLVNENPTNASQLTLNAVANYRYMDDMLMSCNSFSDLQTIALEGVDLFGSRGFKMRKWIANCHAKGILSAVPKCDLAACLEEVNIGSDPLPDSGALGLMWNPQKDELRVNCKEFVSACTKREMTKQLASQFDPMGIISPFLLGGKLLLQRVATSGVDWDEVLPMEVQECWNKWLGTLQLIRKVSIPRNCFPDNLPFNHDAVKFQLHAFCDASNSAFSCVILLRCWFNDRVEIKFMIWKCRVVLTSQANWIISRKELEAAKICSELML